MHPFHLALTVHDLAAAERFYGEALGCTEGRRAPTWIDYDLLGHQLSLHLDPDKRVEHFENPVDGKQVPLPHFGLVLPMDEWQRLADRLVANPFTRVGLFRAYLEGLAGTRRKN